METNIQPNSPEQPQLEPKENWFLRHEVLYSVIGVLILAVIGGCVYLWKAQKDTTENLDQVSQNNLKFYADTEFGFEVKYPNNWTAKKCKSGEVIVGEFNTETFSCNSFDRLGYLRIGSEEKFDFQAAVTDTSKGLNNPTQETIQLNNVSATKISGQSNTLMNEDGKIGLKTVDVLLYSNGILYTLSYFDMDEKVSKFNDQVILSFKLNPSLVTKKDPNDPANWEIHYGSGYQISYPKGWGVSMEGGEDYSADHIRNGKVEISVYTQGGSDGYSLRELAKTLPTQATDEVINGKKVSKKTVNSGNKVFARYYFVDKINNTEDPQYSWIPCVKLDNNCGRVDILAETSADFTLARKVLGTLKERDYEQERLDQINQDNPKTTNGSIGKNGGAITLANGTKFSLAAGMLTQDVKFEVKNLTRSELNDEIEGSGRFPLYGNVVVNPFDDGIEEPAASENYEATITVPIVYSGDTQYKIELKAGDKLQILHSDQLSYKFMDYTATVNADGKTATFQTSDIGTFVLMREQDRSLGL